MVHQYDDAEMSSSRDVVLAHITRCHQWLVGMVPILLSTTLLVLRSMDWWYTTNPHYCTYCTVPGYTYPR